MVRYRRASGQRVLTGLLMSAHKKRDPLFGDELLAAEESKSGFSFALALTREPATRESDSADVLTRRRLPTSRRDCPPRRVLCLCVGRTLSSL